MSKDHWTYLVEAEAAMFGMRFAPPKCKMMPQDWVRATPNLSIKGQFIERVDKFTYLGSYLRAFKRRD